MARRRRAIAACALLAGIAAAPAPSAGAQPAGDVATRIRQVESGLLPPVVVAGQPLPVMTLEARMRALNVPGVSIAVVRNGRIDWAKGYGVVRAGDARPVDTATLFQAASISKPVAALGALGLVQQGRLSLDEDVNVRLASWKVPASDIAAGEHVTVRRLVSHNAGLTVHGFPGYARGVAVPTAVQVLDGAPPANTPAVRVDLRPGTQWRYSGGGFTVLQLLMSDVTGRPFADLMDELVLRRAGMHNSTYAQPLPEPLAARAAHAHDRSGAPVSGDWHTYPEQAAAGLWTTPLDLARMIIAVQQSAAEASGAILPPELAHDMLTVQAGDYGLGFALRGDAFGHGGANMGFRAQFIGYRGSGDGLAIMTNSELGGALIEEVMRSVARVYGWPDFAPVEKAEVALDTAELRGLVGAYRFGPAGRVSTMEIVRSGNQLEARMPAWPAPRTLHHAGDRRFFMLETPTELAFEVDAAGRATGFEIRGGGTPVRATRVP